MLDTVLDVFSVIGEWFVQIIQTVLTMFWTVPEAGGVGEPTILGILVLCSLGVGIILLVVNVIADYFRFR